MTGWLDVVDDDRGIRTIYGDETPSLGWVDLHEISLHRDGPRVVLRFDLPDYPGDAPKKWVDQGFNVVQVKFMLVGIHKFSLQGWSHDSFLDLSVLRDGQAVRVSGRSESIEMSIVADAALVSSISAYRDHR